MEIIKRNRNAKTFVNSRCKQYTQRTDNCIISGFQIQKNFSSMYKLQTCYIKVY